MIVLEKEECFPVAFYVVTNSELPIKIVARRESFSRLDVKNKVMSFDVLQIDEIFSPY